MADRVPHIEVGGRKVITALLLHMSAFWPGITAPAPLPGMLLER